MAIAWPITGGVASVCAAACLGIGFAAGWLSRGRDERGRWRDAAKSLCDTSDAVIKAAGDELSFGILTCRIAARMLNMGDPGNNEADASRLFDGLAGELGASLQRTGGLPALVRHPCREWEVFRVAEGSTFNTLGVSQSDGGGDGE